MGCILILSGIITRNLYNGTMGNLSDIFCQERAISSMQRAFDAGRMGHAYLFVGTDGVGKFTAARAWAKMLLCTGKKIDESADGKFYDSCGACQSCRVFEGGGHPDFNEIYKELREFTKDGKGKTTPIDMPIDVIREFVIEKAAAKPAMSEYCVYVIRQAERMNNSSQNALLKVLEEPPKHCVIILLSSRIEKMLPTTQSRCQVVRFGPVDEERIVEHLIAKGIGGDEAKYWARFADGSLGQAIEWATLDLKDNSVYRIKNELVEKVAKYSLADSLQLAEWMLKAAKEIGEAAARQSEKISKSDINRRAIKGVIRMVVSVFQDAMRLGIDQSADNLVNADQAKEIGSLAGRIDPDTAARAVSAGYKNIGWVDASVNEKLIFEELLLNYHSSGIL